MTRARKTAPAAKPETAVAPAATSAPICGLEDISRRMNDVLIAAHDAQALAVLLDSVQDHGYFDANRTDNSWQMKWWAQAGYISRTLERLGEELQANGEAIDAALADIRHGRAPL
jgi:hypothetical protein